MLIIGCDFHPSFQQVAIFDNQTGEYEARRLGHREEAEQFYRSLAGRRVRVGMEACGPIRGSSGCWRSWGSNCGWETRPRFGPGWCASRRRTGFEAPIMGARTEEMGGGTLRPPRD